MTPRTLVLLSLLALSCGGGATVEPRATVETPAPVAAEAQPKVDVLEAEVEAAVVVVDVRPRWSRSVAGRHSPPRKRKTWASRHARACVGRIWW